VSAPVASPTPGVEDDLDAVRALQRALYRAAKADPGRRFHALYDKVHRRDVLERAWEQVRRNAGAPGIDQTTIADVEEYGVDRLLDELAVELRERAFKPLPARRVYIPKPGRDEQRPLSIPAIRDRVVQAALKIVLEPVFEADMLPCSFGFRPKRAAHDALQAVLDESFAGRRWVVESDIADCFTAIPHDGLMSTLSERICDRKVLALVQAFLRAGVMEDGAVRRPVAGTPQGGVISPLLCNVYLNRLDRAWRPAYGRLIRYADDLLVVCRSRGQAEAALARLTTLLDGVGLRPKPEKTRIVQLVEGKRGSTSSAFTTGSCAHDHAEALAGLSSSPAGLHRGRCSMPGTASASSRCGLASLPRSNRSWGRSTAFSAAGPGSFVSGTRPGSSTRSAGTPSCASRCSWPNAISVVVHGASPRCTSLRCAWG
jgi:RNA-directed DNA polymerase